MVNLSIVMLITFHDKGGSFEVNLTALLTNMSLACLPKQGIIILSLQLAA